MANPSRDLTRVDSEAGAALLPAGAIDNTVCEPRVVVATAGWAIPRASSSMLPAEGSRLARYSRALDGVEINTSFYRAHRVNVYERWASTTPAGFRFAVKVPRLITHDLRLRRARAPLEQFLEECHGLGGRLGPLLIQLPPSLVFERRAVSTFLTLLRGRFGGQVVCEPRHESWTSPAAEQLLTAHRVARVAADPARTPALGVPGGWSGLVYLRLHGSPRMYWSRYSAQQLEEFAALLQRPVATERWCTFDNTAGGAALENALAMQRLLADTPS